MPWQPTYSATDVRPIVGNLKAFFEEHQVAALAWASPSRPLAPLTIYDSAEVRIKDDFPHMGLVKRRVATVDTDAGLAVTYDLTFEFEIKATHTADDRTAKLTELRGDADNYARAFESMILNCPDATLLEGVEGATRAYKAVTALDPLEVAVSETESLFNVQLSAAIVMTQVTYE